MEKRVFFIVILVCALLQVSILDRFSLLGIKPDLLLACALLGAMLFQGGWAFTFSVSCGICKDAFSSGVPAMNTIAFVLWCYFILKLRRQITLDNNLIRALVILILAAIHNIASGLIYIYSGGFLPLGIFLRIVILGPLYTAAVLPLLFRGIRPFYPELSR
ncbi:MAG: rod shape-determining protein MreD [Candidatus Omnitrophica bacterium]|nr:rod shape-determining protein MreD [Candidatus Omnitrophota bacterium]